ncbi:MAG: cell division protein FtsA [Candidatus Nealsonbacteria bacterium]
MAREKIITGIDIGTYSIKALSAVQKNGSHNWEVLSSVETPSFGVRRGVVFDVEKVSKNIGETVEKLKQETGHKIDSVYVNIEGSHIFSSPSRGSVIVSRADKKISQEDVNRAIQAAQAFSLPSNNQILEVFAREFIVDGQGQIKEPCDMQGLKLETEILALCAFSPYIKNLTNSVLNSGVHVADMVPSFLASARAILTPQQKELGVCLLDIGGGTTDFTVYQEGDLVHAAVFPIGSAHITNDLAVGLKTDIELAEQIKQEFGSCLSKGSKKEKIDSGNGETLIFSQKALVKIIEARVSEIFDLAQGELKKVLPDAVLPAGIVLTGGGVKLPRIVELAKKELKLPIKIGTVQEEGFEGFTSNPAFSTVCGLVLGAGELDHKHFDSANSQKPSFNRLKKIFKIFIP